MIDVIQKEDQGQNRPGWRAQKLGDLLKIKHGYAFKGEFFSDSGPFIVLTPGNFDERGGFRQKGEKEKYYRGDFPLGYLLKKDDLLVVMTEQAEGLLGSPAMIPANDLYLHNQRLGLVEEVKLEEIDKRYLYYLFNSRSVRQQIRSTSSGTKVRHTSPTRIYEVETLVPNVAVQRRIADILLAYDDLIENNTRRIALLEELAQSLYREWFVHFRFPGYENVPMVMSEIGPIPEGWEVQPVGNVIKTLGGGTPATGESEFWDDGDIVWFSPTDLTSANSMFVTDSKKRITVAGLQKSSANRFPEYSVMMTSRATIGVTAINTRAACTNQGFITCIPNDRLSAAQIYYWLAEQKTNIISLASGATFKEINRTTFRSLPILLPDDWTSDLFAANTDVCWKEIEVLLAKNANLRCTRDLLLPKLISGEIEVSALADVSV